MSSRETWIFTAGVLWGFAFHWIWPLMDALVKSLREEKERRAPNRKDEQ